MGCEGHYKITQNINANTEKFVDTPCVAKGSAGIPMPDYSQMGFVANTNLASANGVYVN